MSPDEPIENIVDQETNIVEQSTFITKKNKPRISYFWQFGILMGLIGCGLIAGSLFGMVVWMMMTGKFPTAGIEKDMMNPVYANPLKAMQLALSFGMFFLPTFFYAMIVNKKPLQHLGFRSLVSAKQILLVILIACVGLFLSGALGELNEIIPIPKKLASTFHKWEDDYSEQVMAMASMKTAWDYIFTMIVIAVAPAIFEEVLFRGGFQQLFIKWFGNVLIGIIVTSILFSAVHVSYFGFLPRAALGVILGLLFYYGKNIWLNILAHCLNNGIAVTQLYAMSKNGKIPKEALNDNMPFFSGPPSAITTILLVIIGIIFMIQLMKSFKMASVRIGADKIDNTFSPSDNPFE